MKVLVTGASGLIGKKISQELVRRGHEVVVISRQSDARSRLPFPCEIVQGDLERGPVSDPRLKTVEGVIHLAGENVGAGRWTSDRKRRILNSRIEGTRHLWRSLEGAPIQTIVGASAIGYYAPSDAAELDENSKEGSDFLAQVCRQWESAQKAHPFEARQCIIRLGVVLSETGGMLEKLRPIFMRGLGGALGSGSQWMSWIHLQDAARAFVWALENASAKGVYNAVSPTPITNAEFTRMLARSLGANEGPAVPEFALKIVLGEQAGMALSSHRVSSARLREAGFQFQHPAPETSLADLNAYAKGGDELLLVEQYIGASPENVFPFFSSAENLGKITPAFLNFKIDSVSTPKMGMGTLLDYSLRIRGIPVRWQTEIETWNPPHGFTDTQLKGPYSRWHHTHVFEKLGSGTLMTDRILYRLPLGAIGGFSAGWLVRKDLKSIFDFRRKIVGETSF